MERFHEERLLGCSLEYSIEVEDVGVCVGVV